MTPPTLYPSTPAPQHLAVNGDTGIVTLTPHTGSGDAAYGSLNTTFIRIAASGTAATMTLPKVELIAVNSTTATEGSPVVITATAPFSGATSDLRDGTNPQPQAWGYFTSSPYLNNVYLLKVIIGNSNPTLKMRITNDTAEARDYVWVVADDEVGTLQPWISVSAASLSFAALINEDAAITAQNLVVANKGTGPLTINGVGAAIGADFKLLAASLSPIPPNTTSNLTIGFTAPPTVGTSTASYSVASSDAVASHIAPVSLSGTTQALEVTMLLDYSGSMGWLPNADPAPTVPVSRWGELTDATNHFLDLLSHFGENKGKFGIARFPAKDPLNPSTYDIVAPTTIPHSMAGAQAAIAIPGPTNSTPMGDGIDRVLAPATSYFATDAASVDGNRRWLLLMSDGAHNSGTHHPYEFVAPPVGTAVAGASLADKKIKAFTVAYGIDGKSDVDLGLMKNIAQGSLDKGKVARVDQDGITATALAAAFRTAIKDGLTNATSPSDPYGQLTSQKPQATHQILITPYDTKAVFVLNWNTPNSERMRLELISPTCDLITPESAGDDTDSDGSPPGSGSGILGISYRSGNRYQMYRIDTDYLRNAADETQPRYGTWRMVVSSAELSDDDSVNDSERYTYDVLVESRLRLETRLDRDAYYAGDPISISAILTVDGAPITNASVRLSLNAPLLSFENWLAGIQITDDEYQAAAKALDGQDVGALFIKAYAARQKGLSFEALRNDGAFVMTDPNDEGVYSAMIGDTSTPETYTFYITATGLTADGFLFRREKSVQVQVGVRPEPAYTLFDISYAPFTPGQPALATVRVTPRDRFGNMYLRDLVSNPSLALGVKNGNFTGPLVSQLNGSYTQQLAYSPGAAPIISLQVDGVDVIPAQPIAPALDLSYADTVFDFKPGDEAEQGANKHTDPSAALGSVLQKPADSFVSLGAYGALTVGVKGRTIRAQGADDVTVFVHSDQLLRAYRVEAYVSGRKDRWVSLGDSPGVTQSFSLGAAGLKTTRTVRVVDLSGQTRDTSFGPSPTPGVSVRAVGFAELDDDEASFPSSTLLDDFNRDDGPVGDSWSGGTDDFFIADQRLHVRDDGVMYWQPTAFGPSQEAFVTLSAIDPSNSRASVLLKVQGDEPNVRNGAIEARHYAKVQLVRLQVRLPGRDWQVVGEFPATFSEGDQLGARAGADGKVQVFRNGKAIGEAEVDKSLATLGGRIGVRMIDAEKDALDDFGGGTFDDSIVP